MCVSPTHACLFIGILMPAIRAIALLSRETARKNAAFYLKTVRNVFMGCAQTFLRVAGRPAKSIFQRRVQRAPHLLALTLLMTQVRRADDVDDAPAAHDLAVLADLLNRWTNFHKLPTRALPAVAEQIGLLEKARIVMRHHVRLE